jgi:hypothetical protein
MTIFLQKVNNLEVKENALSIDEKWYFIVVSIHF